MDESSCITTREEKKNEREFYMVLIVLGDIGCFRMGNLGRREFIVWPHLPGSALYYVMWWIVCVRARVSASTYHSYFILHLVLCYLRVRLIMSVHTW